MRKAITPVIATVILLLITIAIALMAWVWLSGYIDSISGCIKIVDVKDNIMFLQNCGQVSIPSFVSYIADIDVPVFENDTSLPKGSTKKFTFTYIPKAGMQTLRIVSPYAIVSQGFVFPKAWVIKAAFGQLCIVGDCYFQVIGDVYLNDGSGRKYTNKPVNVNIDNGIINQDVITNTTGGFSVNTTWNFTALFPGSWWPVSYMYDKTVEELIIEPPGRITYTDNSIPPVTGNITTPQALYRLKNIDKFIAWKDMSPLTIDPQFVSFQLNYTITSNPNYQPRLETLPNGSVVPLDVWYSAVFTNPDVTVRCYDTPESRCRSAGNTVVNTTTDLADKVFDTNVVGDVGEFTVNGIAHSPFANETPVVLRVQINNATLDSNGYADIASIKALDTITINEEKIIQDGKTISWHVLYNLSKLQEERRLRYNDNSMNGTYIAAVTIITPNGQHVFGSAILAFTVNQPILPSGLFDIATPSQQITWSIPNFNRNQSYHLAADVSVPRKASTSTFGIITEKLFFVNSTTEVNDSYTVTSGGVPVGTSSDDNSFEMEIPSLTQDLMYYTIGIPLGFGINISFITKTYLANTGQPGGRAFTGITIFTARGEKKTCQQSLGRNGGIVCNFGVNPLPQEIVQNMVLISLAGSYNPIFSFGVKGVQVGSCTLPPDPLNPNPECDPYAKCRGASCTYNRCGPNVYCDESARVGGSSLFTVNVDIAGNSFPNPGDTVQTTINLWNWYLNPTPLWANKGTHRAVFYTKDPKPFFPATVFYTFIT